MGSPSDRLDMSPADRRQLLERAITLSGQSARAFAEDQLVRDERTIRRMRAGDTDIPDVVVRKLGILVREWEKKR